MEKSNSGGRHVEFTLAKRATYLKIYLDRILENLRLLKTRLAPHTEIIAVLKSNAYGHGSVPVAKCLEAHGYSHVAVTSVQEGEEIRRGGFCGFIQVFGHAVVEEIQCLYQNQLTPTVADVGFLYQWADYARKQEMSPQSIILKIDTGLTRFGCLPGDLPGLVQDRGVKLHVASSGAILKSIGTELDFVRPGLAMYGQVHEEYGLKPAIEWFARAILVKECEENQSVGYGKQYRCPGPETLAVVPVGYGDGYSGLNYKKGVLTTDDDIQCHVVGQISMDVTMVRLPKNAESAREFCVLAADFNDVNSCFAISKNTGIFME